MNTFSSFFLSAPPRVCLGQRKGLERKEKAQRKVDGLEAELIASHISTLPHCTLLALTQGVYEAPRDKRLSWSFDRDDDGSWFVVCGRWPQKGLGWLALQLLLAE